MPKSWHFWRWPLANLILLGLLLGAAAGLAVNAAIDTPAAQQTLRWWIEQVTQPLGRVFIRIIFMIVVPLIFAAIVLGVAEMGDVRRLGRVGLRSLWFTALLSGSAVLLGLVLVNVLGPGRVLPEETRTALAARYSADAAGKVAQAQQAKPLGQTLLQLIPENPLVDAVNAFTYNPASSGLIGVMVFSLFFGVALTLLPRERATPVVAVLAGVFEACLRIIGFAMALAPVGVACLAFNLTAELGWGVVRSLGFYAAVVVGGLALQQFGTYALFLRFGAGVSPRKFFGRIREAMLTAFATSSSNATLPVSLRVAQEKLGLPADISRFVLTVGASANQNGTALYEGVTVLFLAQVFGVELTLAQQVVVFLMCVMAGFGTAGVPGGSLPLVVGVLVTIGVPGDSIAIILGIDRVLDMCRTTLNVTGDLVCATLVAKGATDPGLKPQTA